VAAGGGDGRFLSVSVGGCVGSCSVVWPVCRLVEQGFGLGRGRGGFLCSGVRPADGGGGHSKDGEACQVGGCG
jgi:hypothetical protein